MSVQAEPRPQLLRTVFRTDLVTGAADDHFMVLRNDEALPDGLSGTDLDVCVCPGRRPAEVVGYLVDAASSVGWSAVTISRRPHMVGFGLVREGENGPDAIHFDVFNGISYLGIPLCEPSTLYRESTVRDGVRVLSARAKALTTVTHHLAWNGYLSKQKYRDELAAVLGSDGEWLRSQLAEVFGSALTERICSRHGIEELATASVTSRLRISSALARRSFARWGVTEVVRRILGYWGGQLGSFRSPPGIVGLAGDQIRHLPLLALSPQLACGVSPHGCWAPSPRCHPSAVRTLNGPRYQRTTSRAWRRWTLLRWTLPSFFLFYQAKRNRVVVLSARLPLGLRLLRRVGRPAWIGVQASAVGRSGG